MKHSICVAIVFLLFIGYVHAEENPGVMERTGALIELKGHTHLIKSAVFSPDGTKVATASYDKTARIWDFHAGKVLLLEGHENILNAVAFSPDGTRVVTAGTNTHPRIWDAESGIELQKLERAMTINSIAFTPDGAKIVTLSNNAVIRIWDAESGKELRMIEGNTLAVAVIVSQDGKQIVMAGSSSIRTWDLDSGRELKKVEWRGEGTLGSKAFSPDGNKIVTMASHFRIHDSDTGAEVQRLVGHEGPIASAAFSGDGKKIVTRGHDTTVRVWDVESGKELLKLDESLLGRDIRSGAFRVAFSLDGTQIIATGLRTAQIWDWEQLVSPRLPIMRDF